jgi:glycosyltransferase involved in cell wall biosynthesis
VRRLLFLARIHPIKGVDVLLRAWRQLEADFPDWELHIAGPADPPRYLQVVQGLTRDLGVHRVFFPGPCYGQAKSDTFVNSELYVLPTHSENFGITIAEALAHGVPVITTRGAPWAGLIEQRCGWWIEPAEGPLTACLREVLAMPSTELSQYGDRGRAWMERDFSWPRIAERMRDTYLWMLGGGPPPDWVRIDK